jgi:hypothetical protein
MKLHRIVLLIILCSIVDLAAASDKSGGGALIPLTSPAT